MAESTPRWASEMGAHVRICIVGAGGLGSVIAGWLADSGVDVTLVGRPGHIGAIRENGLTISGIRGRSVIRELTAVTHPNQASGEFDYFILAVKAWSTSEALAESSVLLDRTAVALSLQNTVSKEDELSEWIGADRVIGASTIEGGVIQSPGVVAHTATAPTTAYFGELDGKSSRRVGSLVDAFLAAGFTTTETDEIHQVEWEKLLQIAIVGSWSASTFGALGGSVGQGLLVKEAAEQYVQLTRELLAVYRAMGYEPADYYAPYSRFRAFHSWTFDQAVTEMSALGRSMVDQGLFGRPSLHEDLRHGRPTEIEQSVGTWLRKAEQLGLEVPTAYALYRIVKSLEYWLGELGGATPLLSRPAS
jgi:2-dehydropantoate 2-reductase